jgi:hypothetical protein
LSAKLKICLLRRNMDRAFLNAVKLSLSLRSFAGPASPLGWRPQGEAAGKAGSLPDDKSPKDGRRQKEEQEKQTGQRTVSCSIHQASGSGQSLEKRFST